MPRRTGIDAVINGLAARTCSVVHARDLRRAGVSRDAVARRIESGSMRPILPSTYAVGPACGTPTFDMRCMAGVLAGGGRSVLDGSSAARLLDTWDRGGDVVQVTVPGQRPRVARDGFVFHRASKCWVPVDGLRRGPIPIAGYTDICRRLACSLSSWQLAHVIDRGVYERLVTLAALERTVASLAHVTGVTVIREAIELVRSGSVGTRSGSEDRLLEALIVDGIEPPVVNTRGVMGMSRDEPDFVWLPQRVNVEVDGRHHDEPPQAADDALRDAEAERLGWCVLRFRARDVMRHRGRMVAIVRRALDGEQVPVLPGTRRPRLW